MTHAAVETLFKYGDVAGGNLETPINLLFMEYLEKTHTRNLLATATNYAYDRREKPESGEKKGYGIQQGWEFGFVE